MNYNLFVDKLENEIGNVSVTENGATGYATSGKAILDMNFKITSYRNRTATEIINDFKLALNDTPRVTLKWLFFARDVRGGAGERRLFRICMHWLAEQYPDLVREFVPIIADYGRYDDVLELVSVAELRDYVTKYVWETLTSDMKNYEQKKSISLLAKWMPSENASAPATRAAARNWIKRLGLSPKVYRKLLSKLRAYIDVTEVKMSTNNWGEIDYEAVPSKANLNYKGAFMRHDADRRQAYLNALQKGEAKINAATLFPHEIFNRVDRAVDNWRPVTADLVALEAMWKALPDYVKGEGSTICVRDGSGSMTSSIDGNYNSSLVSCLDVASALSVYFAERCSGAFKDKFITFSENPKLVDMSGCKTLEAKARLLRSYNECANTNIEAVFDLILNTAIKNGMSQKNLPKNILILSDMEFDTCTTCYSGNRWARKAPSKKLFDEIKRRYESAGYKLPRLIFWNICSRTNTIPLTQNDLGIALVSGFSTAIIKMVLSGKLDPFECLVETLNDKRYDAVDEVIKRYVTK